MQYRIKEKISQNLSCNILAVTANHLILCNDKKLQCLVAARLMPDSKNPREWILDDLVTYLKVIGGPANQECVIAGKILLCIQNIFDTIK